MCYIIIFIKLIKELKLIKKQLMRSKTVKKRFSVRAGMISCCRDVAHLSRECSSSKTMHSRVVRNSACNSTHRDAAGTMLVITLRADVIAIILLSPRSLPLSGIPEWTFNNSLAAKCKRSVRRRERVNGASARKNGILSGIRVSGILERIVLRDRS